MMDLTAQILVIDDDKAMRDACYQTLLRQGYQVELAASARQGLTLLERISFDVILLDLVMSDLAFGGTILSSSVESSGVSLKDLERNHIIHTLQRFDGHKSETARALGIDRKTLREKLKRYNIE